MRSLALAILLTALGCRAHVAAGPPAAVTTAPEVFAALKARDVGMLSAILAANPALARARRPDGTSAIAVALFTLNDDEETFVKPPDNALLRELVARRPPLDVYDAAAIGDVARLRAILSGDPALAGTVHPRLGIAPLHFAAFGGSVGAVELLLASGAPIDLPSRNEFHNTPLLLSVLSDQQATAGALLARGADVEAWEEGHVRALHLAAELGDVKMLALLLDHHAAIDERTDDGETALAVALERGHVEAAEMLRSRGAR